MTLETRLEGHGVPVNRVRIDAHRRGLLVAVLVIALSAAGAACSSSGSSSKSTTTTAARNYSISTSDGQVTVSLDGHLPPGWPSAFPVPSGAKPAGSGSVTGGSEGVMVAVYTLSGSPQDAFDFYKSSSDLHVDDSSSVGGTNTFVGRVKFSGTYSGEVTIGKLGSANGSVVVLHSSGASTTSSTSV
jgi:hypothetical protein